MGTSVHIKYGDFMEVHNQTQLLTSPQGNPLENSNQLIISNDYNVYQFCTDLQQPKSLQPISRHCQAFLLRFNTTLKLDPKINNLERKRATIGEYSLILESSLEVW